MYPLALHNLKNPTCIVGTVFPGATNYTRYYTENFSIIDIHAMTHN